MNSRIVIDGNAFYEIDEECVRKRTEETESGICKELHYGKKQPVNSDNQKVRTS